MTFHCGRLVISDLWFGWNMVVGINRLIHSTFEVSVSLSCSVCSWKISVISSLSCTLLSQCILAKLILTYLLMLTTHLNCCSLYAFFHSSGHSEDRRHVSFTLQNVCFLHLQNVCFHFHSFFFFCLLIWGILYNLFLVHSSSTSRMMDKSQMSFFAELLICQCWSPWLPY